MEENSLAGCSWPGLKDEEPGILVTTRTADKDMAPCLRHPRRQSGVRSLPTARRRNGGRPLLRLIRTDSEDREESSGSTARERGYGDERCGVLHQSGWTVATPTAGNAEASGSTSPTGWTG